MRFKLVIFDFDGTLADSGEFFLQASNRMADEFGLRRIAPEEVELLRKMDARQIIKYLQLPVWRLPFYLKRVRAMMSEATSEISLFPGVPEMLLRLRAAGVVTALVTSNSEANARAILGREAAVAISHYRCGATLFGKRQKFRRVLRESGIARSDTVCIGDEIRDLDAAHAEQIAFGAVSWGYTRIEAFDERAPEKVFATVSEMADWLCGNLESSASH